MSTPIQEDALDPKKIAGKSSSLGVVDIDSNRIQSVQSSSGDVYFEAMSNPSSAEEILEFEDALATAQNVALGFQSSNPADNFVAGHALASLLRSLDPQMIKPLTTLLPIVARVLESRHAVTQMSETLRLFADVIQEECFTNNAAAGLRLVCRAIDDEEVFKTLTSLAQVASNVVANDKVNTALSKGVDLATLLVNHPKFQEAVEYITESEQINSTVSLSFEKGVNVAKTLMKNERVVKTTKASLNLATQVMQNEKVQQTLTATVQQGAHIANSLMENESLNYATGKSAQVVGTVLNNDYVSRAAWSTVEIAKNALNSQPIQSTYGYLYNAVSYLVDEPEKSLEELKEELENSELQYKLEMSILKEKQELFEKNESEAKLRYEAARTNLSENRIIQQKLEKQLKAKQRFLEEKLEEAKKQAQKEEIEKNNAINVNNNNSSNSHSDKIIELDEDGKDTSVASSSSTILNTSASARNTVISSSSSPMAPRTTMVAAAAASITPVVPTVTSSSESKDHTFGEEGASYSEGQEFDYVVF